MRIDGEQRRADSLAYYYEHRAFRLGYAKEVRDSLDEAGKKALKESNRRSSKRYAERHKAEKKAYQQRNKVRLNEQRKVNAKAKRLAERVQSWQMVKTIMDYTKQRAMESGHIVEIHTRFDTETREIIAMWSNDVL